MKETAEGDAPILHADNENSLAQGRGGRPSSRLYRATLALSFGVHAAILAYILHAVPFPGATNRESEAISVELAPTEVIEASEEAAAEQAANAPSEPTPGKAETTPEPSPQEEAKKEPVEAPKPPEPAQEMKSENAEAATPSPPAEEAQPAAPEQAVKPIQTADESRLQPPLPQTAHEAAAAPVPQAEDEKKLKQPVEAPKAELEEPKPSLDKQKPPVEEQKPVAEPAKPLTRQERDARRRRQKQDHAGAAAARGSTDAEKAGARISASRGSARNYALIVRARVAAHKPRGGSGSGASRVVFIISETGALQDVRIQSSSGNPALDAAAMNAVRRAAPFPPPPPGAERFYAMPFYFR